MIPGVFLALLLRYDALAALRRGALRLRGSAAPVRPGGGAALADPVTMAGASFPRPFFNVGLLAYTGGLVATLAVMVLWDHAQPALLYLVPAVLGASALTAVARGEVKALMWGYTDECYTTELLGKPPAAAAGEASGTPPAAPAQADAAPEPSDGGSSSSTAASPAASGAGGARRRVTAKRA